MAYKEVLEAKRAELSLAIVGTALLYFGWFGFNGGSTLVVSGQSGYAVANTAVAGSLAGAVALILSRARDKVWGPIMAIGGVLGGLVFITPLAGFVDFLLSFAVGVAAGVATYFASKLMVQYYFIDNPVGSFPVHGVNGILGSMMVPILSASDISGMRGLIYGGSLGWVAVQWLGMLIALVFVVVTTYAVAKLIAKFFRAKLDEEIVGLDAVDHRVRP